MEDISPLRGAGKILLSLVTAAPAGGVIVAVGNAAVTCWELPGAVKRAYRTLWKTERYGPVVKSTVSAVLPFGALAIPPTTLFVSAIVGLGYGFYRGCEGPFIGMAKSADLVSDFNQMGIEVALRWLEKPEPLKDGEKPFDIPIGKGLRGLAAAAVISHVEAFGLTGVTLWRWPRGVRWVYASIWDRWPEDVLMFALQIALSVLAVPVALIVIPLTPSASYGVGIFEACQEGYRNGFRAAFRRAVKRVGDVNRDIREVLAESCGKKR